MMMVAVANARRGRSGMPSGNVGLPPLAFEADGRPGNTGEIIDLWDAFTAELLCRQSRPMTDESRDAFRA